MRITLRERITALRYAQGWLGPHGVKANHGEKTMIFSAEDDPARPSERLLDVALAAAQAARAVDLSALDARLAGPPYWPSVWPGEHYRLLAGLAQVLAPTTIIEIGTATGLSALALGHGAPEATVATYDIVSWREYPGAVLRDDDFADGRLVQHLDDVTHPEGLTVLFTTRTPHLSAHAGQVSFPGGRLDPGEDAIAAALREAELIAEVLLFNTGSGASYRF